MGRRDYDRFSVTGSGGINEQPELAAQNQLADTRNQWAPDGRVVQRPGYLGVSVAQMNRGTAQLATLGTVTVVENPIGTFNTTSTLSNLPAGARWYLGFSAGTVATIGAFKDYYLSTTIGLTDVNTNSVAAAGEYWNGSTWAPLYFVPGSTSGPDTNKAIHLSDADSASHYVLYFQWPDDLAESTVNTQTKYFFRFTIISMNDAALDALTTFTGATVGSLTTNTFRAFFQAQFPATKRYVTINQNANTVTTVDTTNSGAFLNDGSVIQLTTTPEISRVGEWSIAVVPQFSEVYCNYNYAPLVFKAAPVSTDIIAAAVESDATFVGTGAQYDKDQIPQLNTWPRAKFTTFFRGKVWAANLDGEPYTIRWSAPAPFYKIWPTVQAEFLMEDDNSPITGLRGYGQHMMVFKEDSIWRFVEGPIENGLETMVFDRVVDGIGCVANGSVEQIQGRQIFMSKDGIYAFDGTPNCSKVTLDQKTGADRLKKTFARINPGARNYSRSVHWRKHSCYLLAVPVDGSDVNNLIIVWDYKNDTFWLWDNIPAQGWLLDDGTSPQQLLYFVNQFGSVFQLELGNSDHGKAITSYGLTQRLGFDSWKKRLRELKAISTNNSNVVSLEVRQDDRISGTSGNIDFLDSAEANWGDFALGVNAFSTERRSQRRLDFNEDGEWFQVKFSHNTKGTSFALTSLSLGTLRLGPR